MALDFVVDVFVGSDGAKYYGTLRNGVPSGVGTCIWPNNCHYDGEWRNGVMHGFGTYVWANGQRYDGEWKVRLPPKRHLERHIFQLQGHQQSSQQCMLGHARPHSASIAYLTPLSMSTGWT